MHRATGPRPQTSRPPRRLWASACPVPFPAMRPNGGRTSPTSWACRSAASPAAAAATPPRPDRLPKAAEEAPQRCVRSAPRPGASNGSYRRCCSSSLPWQHAFGAAAKLHVVHSSDDGDDDDDGLFAGTPEPAPPRNEGDSAGLWVNVDAAAARKSLDKPQPWSADAAGRGLLLVGDVGADGKGGLPWPLPPFSFGEVGHAASGSRRGVGVGGGRGNA